ncbi:MAG: hypothetical protein OEY85_07075 [Rhodospirillales bacterium]|nr:hypothetical protein [Rhodospirillales bacterium]
MADKKSPGNVEEGIDLSDLVSEEDETVISLMRQDMKPPADSSVTHGGSRENTDPGKVRASIRAIPERDSVMVALEYVEDPSRSASILLSSNDTLLMAQKLFDQSMALPTPPTEKSIKSALEKIVKVTQIRMKK